MSDKQRICIDFDGTIYTGDAANPIFPGCVKVLTELQQTYTIAIFSARLTDAERWHMSQLLREHGVPYDEILPRKPEAAFYIDDKGRQFQGWDKLTL
jgi:trehalose-6-phosphatase